MKARERFEIAVETHLFELCKVCVSLSFPLGTNRSLCKMSEYERRFYGISFETNRRCSFLLGC